MTGPRLGCLGYFQVGVTNLMCRITYQSQDDGRLHGVVICMAQGGQEGLGRISGGFAG